MARSIVLGKSSTIVAMLSNPTSENLRQHTQADVSLQHNSMQVGYRFVIQRSQTAINYVSEILHHRQPGIYRSVGVAPRLPHAVELDHAKAIAVARLAAEIGMNKIAPQNPLIGHTGEPEQRISDLAMLLVPCRPPPRRPSPHR